MPPQLHTQSQSRTQSPTPREGFLPGFTLANGTVTPRLILSLDALEGAGKTRFALTAPGPIAFMNFDYGLEGVIEKFQTAKPIYVAKYSLDFDPLSNDKADKADPTPQRTKRIIEAAESELQRFHRDYLTALGQARTLVIDTGTELWELLRLASFGKLTQVMPHQYAAVNQAMTRLVKQAYDSSCNLILTHKLKEQWVNDKKTGDYEFAGQRDIPFLVQVHCRLWTDMEGFHLKINKCRQNVRATGIELTNELITFPMLAELVFPESEEASWA